MNKEEIKVKIKDCVYSEDGITYMSDKQYNNYIDTIEQFPIFYNTIVLIEDS